MKRLIDAVALEKRMYHDTFETDNEMQKWDSGCWIRYKMFEKAIAEAPTEEPERDKGKVNVYSKLVLKESIETLRANYPDACYERLREAVDVAIYALTQLL